MPTPCLSPHSLFPIHLCPRAPPFFSTTKQITPTLTLLLPLLCPLDEYYHAEQSHLIMGAIRITYNIQKAAKGNTNCHTINSDMTYMALQLFVMYLCSKSAWLTALPFSPWCAAALSCFPVLGSMLQQEDRFHMLHTEEVNENNGRMKRGKEAERDGSVRWIYFFLSLITGAVIL